MLKKQNNSSLRFLNQTIETITIEVEKDNIIILYDLLLKEKQKEISIIGFEKGKILISYLKENYRKTFERIISETFFYIYAYKKIIEQLRFKKKFLNIHNIKPKIEIDLINFKLLYTYTIPISDVSKDCSLSIKKVKIPERKKYKDLDKQAEVMVKQEEKNSLLKGSYNINYGDWIKIDVNIIDKETNEILFKNLNFHLWIRISSEEIDKKNQYIFFNKMVNDIIITESTLIQSYICQNSFIQYLFQIKIIEHISSLYFSFEKFKNYFLCKDNNAVYNKLIEVFSFKNDICLFRETAQIFFKYMLDIYKINIPKDVVSEFINTIEKDIKFNPDYLIFQANSLFYKYINMLACKQVQETILIDYFSYIDKIIVNNNDIYWYLNITQRNRLCNFLYFDYSFIKYKHKEVPILHEVIEQMVIREKTLNKRINNLKDNI